MKVDINKTYKTKSGLPVVIYAVHEGHKNYHVHGAYLKDDDDWHVTMWRLDGHFYRADKPSEFDLVEVRTKRVVWINEYEDGLGLIAETKEIADKYVSMTRQRIALHRVVLNEDTMWQADAEREEGDE